MAGGAARGRPRKFDKEEKLRIIQQEFWRKGFAATSLDDLSAATGLSRPSLYAAYGDKLAMYLAALRAFAERMAVAAGGSLEQAEDLRGALVGFYRAALDIYFGEEERALGCLVFTTAISDAAEDPAIREAVSGFLGEMDAALEAALRRHCPDLAEARRRELAKLAGGLLTGLATRARAGASRAELDAMAAASAAVIAGDAGT